MRRVLGLVVLAALAGCDARHDPADLAAYAAEVKARTNDRIEPLPLRSVMPRTVSVAPRCDPFDSANLKRDKACAAS